MSPVPGTYVTAGVPSVAVSPVVVSVIVVDEDGAVFVTVPEPATVKESEMAVPETGSLVVTTMVLSAVLTAVNVGGALSTEDTAPPSVSAFVAAESSRISPVDWT